MILIAGTVRILPKKNRQRARRRDADD